MDSALPTDLAAELRTIWHDYRPTRLIELPALARLAGVGRVMVKAEWERPLGNFKALGGMVAGLRALARSVGAASLQALLSAPGHRARLAKLICASDGNHGLAVAAAAHRAGTAAIVYLPMSVSRTRADRIAGLGGDVVRVAGTYDDAVAAAAAAAARGEGLLIPDTSRDPRDPAVRDVMAGYAALTGEIVAQLQNEVRSRPSHAFVQAGVGGLAAAMAQGLRGVMQASGKLVIVEPESAACVAHALAVGRPERIEGELRTCAGMLSCGIASAHALEILRRYDTGSVLVAESALRDAVETLRRTVAVCTTPSGAAGLAGLLQVASRPELRAMHGLGTDSEVLLVITEGPVVAGDSSVCIGVVVAPDGRIRGEN